MLEHARQSIDFKYGLGYIYWCEKSMRLSKPRIKPIEKSEIDEEEQKVLGLSKRRSRLNVYRTLAQHPKLLQRWFVFARYILEESTLSPRDRELLILRIGWLCKAEYEFSHHTIYAKEAGLTEQEILRITKGPTANGWSTFEVTLLQAVDELYENAFISDTTWEGLTKHYSKQQLMDLVFTVGEYTLVSIALNSFGVQLEELAI